MVVSIKLNLSVPLIVKWMNLMNKMSGLDVMKLIYWLLRIMWYLIAKLVILLNLNVREFRLRVHIVMIISKIVVLSNVLSVILGIVDILIKHPYIRIQWGCLSRWWRIKNVRSSATNSLLRLLLTIITHLLVYNLDLLLKRLVLSLLLLCDIFNGGFFFLRV